jgi:hypothetical protein
LLTQALVEAVEELGDEVGRVVRDDPARQWLGLIDSFTTHRALWLAQVEAAVQAERSSVVREHLARGQSKAREGVGGSVRLALVTGLMLQWLVDPDTAPSSEQVAAELTALLHGSA